VGFGFAKPYAAQFAIIDRLLRAARRGEHALLEAPTGSGKTQALLCASLAWISSQAAQSTAAAPAPPTLAPVADLTTSTATSSSPSTWTPQKRPPSEDAEWPATKRTTTPYREAMAKVENVASITASSTAAAPSTAASSTTTTTSSASSTAISSSTAVSTAPGSSSFAFEVDSDSDDGFEPLLRRQAKGKKRAPSAGQIAATSADVAVPRVRQDLGGATSTSTTTSTSSGGIKEASALPHQVQPLPPSLEGKKLEVGTQSVVAAWPNAATDRAERSGWQGERRSSTARARTRRSSR